MTNGGLNEKQSRFVDEYMKDLKAGPAYERAGYGSRSANTRDAAASRLLRSVKVWAEVERRLAARAEQVGITKDWVLQQLVEGIQRDMRQVPVLDREGNETGEWRYEASAVNRKIELAGKHLGMFGDKMDLTSGGDPIRMVEVVRTVREDALADQEEGIGAADAEIARGDE